MHSEENLNKCSQIQAHYQFPNWWDTINGAAAANAHRQHPFSFLPTNANASLVLFFWPRKIYLASDHIKHQYHTNYIAYLKSNMVHLISDQASSYNWRYSYDSPNMHQSTNRKLRKCKVLQKSQHCFYLQVFPPIEIFPFYNLTDSAARSHASHICFSRCAR